MNYIQNSFKPNIYHLDLQMNSIKFCEIYLYQTYYKYQEPKGRKFDNYLL